MSITNLFMTTALMVVAVLLTTSMAAQSVEPIWLSPTSVGFYPETYPELNVWLNLTTGAGARVLTPVVAMDSKKTLWFLFGDSTSWSYSVWNYNPKTDLYRRVFGPGNATAAILSRNPGELRVPSPDNWPGTISKNPGTIDHNDNIWFMTVLEGGEIWMFNTTSYEFTRMQGFNEETFTPVFGTLGQPGYNVTPGYTHGGCIVTDSLNNIWQIGGTANSEGYRNRIWHFNTTSYEWTFFGGNTSSSQALTRFGNDPFYGGRDAQACDIDDNDRVWLFGGIGYGYGAAYNDVWSYDTRTLQWRLEFGSDATLTTNAIVNVTDDFDAGNVPNGRSYATFVDRQDGTLLLHGGFLTTTNDIWLFHKSLKQWKLIYGDPFQLNNTGDLSHYRTPGSVLPGTRYLHGVARGLNIEGDVFIYGGGAGSGIYEEFYNDVWLIPQEHCANSTKNKCSSNALCIEELIGYSCQCNEGFTGDGFTCTSPQPPQSTTPPSPNESPSPTTTPPSSSQPSTTPHRQTRVSRGVIVESSVFVILLLVVLSIV